MEIYVSREIQSVIVPKNDTLYTFARCPECRRMHYTPDVETRRETGLDASQEPGRVVNPYTVMAMPDEEFAPLLTLLTEYETLSEQGETDELDRVDDDISSISEQTFAPYLNGVQ